MIPARVSTLTPVRLTEDFPASMAVAFVGDRLVGACAGDSESYLLRWPSLPGAYEPLLVLPGEAVAVGGAHRSSQLVVVTRHGDKAGVTWLDVDRSRRAELVTPGDLLCGVDAPLVLPSPDDRLVAVSGVRSGAGEELLTLVFELSPEPGRRWMLTGLATRWHEGRLILLEPHGTSAWTPEAGTDFLGDAPPYASPDGRWLLSLTEQGFDIRSASDPIVRSLEMDEPHRVVAGWAGGRVALGDKDALLVDPATLDALSVAPSGYTLRAIRADGSIAVIDDGEWLYMQDLVARG